MSILNKKVEHKTFVIYIMMFIMLVAGVLLGVTYSALSASKYVTGIISFEIPPSIQVGSGGLYIYQDENELTKTYFGDSTQGTQITENTSFYKIKVNNATENAYVKIEFLFDDSVDFTYANSSSLVFGTESLTYNLVKNVPTLTSGQLSTGDTFNIDKILNDLTISNIVSTAKEMTIRTTASYSSDFKSTQSSYDLKMSYKTQKVLNVSQNLSNLTSTNSNTHYLSSSEYTTTLQPTTGYELPSTITVKVGGVVLTNEQYTYNSTTGQLTIFSSAVVGDITITANGTIKQLTITQNLTGCSSSSTQTTINYGTAFNVTYTPSANYSLPTSISVTVDGATISNYTYSSSTGTLSIPANAVIGNIVITVVCESGYQITLDNPTTTYAYYYVGSLTSEDEALNANWQRLEASSTATLTIKTGQTLYINWTYANINLKINSSYDNRTHEYGINQTNSAGILVLYVYSIKTESNGTYTISWVGGGSD